MNRRPPARPAFPLLGALALGLSLWSSVPFAAVAPATPASPQTDATRLTLDFNPDWRFLKADPADAPAPSFDDRDWSIVSTPHTFNDTDTFDNWSTPGHRGEQLQWSGRTWYRKTITAPAAWTGKKVFIEFEAARQIAEVYLNGEKLGIAKTGFTPFGFDLTSHLKIGATNVLAVMVDNRFAKDPLPPELGAQAATTANTHPVLSELSKKFNEAIPEKLEDLQADQIPWNNPHWHPAHGGLYRNVRLIVTDPLHITLPLYSFLQTVGPYVYASDISAESAQIHVEVPVQNDRAAAESVSVHVDLIDADGKKSLSLTASAQPLAPGARTTLKLAGALTHPRPWQPDYPHVYRVVCTLLAAGKSVDTAEIPLGVRATHWDVDRGFFVNGRHEKLHGWGQKPTDEWPGLGAAQPDWLHAYTLDLMRLAGGNFVRWGHTPAGPGQVAATDRLGIVTLQPASDGESDTVGAAWALRQIAFRDVLVYFRNNPSILIWEGGNQKLSREHVAAMRALMDQYDPHGGRGYAHRRADKITAEYSDLAVGTEGGREIASLAVVEGEYNREESPRRVWDDASPPNFGYPEGKGQTYQLTSEQFAVNEVAQYVKKLGAENHSGGANWIFSDSTSGGRVATEVARASGEVDGARLPKEAYYVCRVMFSSEPLVHIIGHWSYPAGTKKKVFVAANTDDVELFVNGKSLGHAKPTDKFLFTFADVTFDPGEIKAVASKGGKEVASQSKRTAGPATALRLTPIIANAGLRADGADIALFDVEAVDANGERCPTVQQRVDFTSDGPATWRGGYNSGKINSTNNLFLDLEAGINRVAVRATRTAGKITVSAKSAGLRDASVTIESHAFDVAIDGTAALAAAPAPRLPATVPAILPSPKSSTAKSKVVLAGRFTRSMNYTGPYAAIVHMETRVQNGKNVYVDRDYTFSDLPASLAGADWLQTADADQRYSAVDLIELAVVGGSVVTIAHDERAPLPEWLAKQFSATSESLTVNGTPMKLFQRPMAKDGSLTFGSNTDGTPVRANQYVVFVNAAK